MMFINNYVTPFTITNKMLETTTFPLTEKSININKLLSIMEYGIPMTSNEIMKKLKIKSKETLRATYLNPAIEDGVVELTIPDKPTSKNQMYYKV